MSRLGFVEIIKLRNKLAKSLGFEDYYDVSKKVYAANAFPTHVFLGYS